MSYFRAGLVICEYFVVLGFAFSLWWVHFFAVPCRMGQPLSLHDFLALIGWQDGFQLCCAFSLCVPAVALDLSDSLVAWFLVFNAFYCFSRSSALGGPSSYFACVFLPFCYRLFLQWVIFVAS